jgi:hypothetical protein
VPDKADRIHFFDPVKRLPILVQETSVYGLSLLLEDGMGHADVRAFGSESFDIPAGDIALRH